jgi:acylphosphatase
MAEFVKVLVNVKGRVQGVFYRHSTREQASKLQISGWVANLPDGTVALEAQGESQQILTLLAWLEKGPPAAVVASVDVIQQEKIDSFDSTQGKFEIR